MGSIPFLQHNGFPPGVYCNDVDDDDDDGDEDDDENDADSTNEMPCWLTFRTPEAVTSASAKVSEKDIRKWFKTVEEYLIENDLSDALKDPARILNGDETGFALNSLSKKVLATKGSRNVSAVDTANGKQNITVLFSFAADGTIIPPDVILPYKRLSREIVSSFPPEWGLGTSDSGWMNSTNFTLYIKKILYPTLLKKGVKFPVLFFVDGHKSHTALEAADVCSKLGIVLIALYPNATRIIQPADVSIFRPLKNSWETIIDSWKTEQSSERVTIPLFGKLLREAMERSLKKSTITNAFRACGLFPFDPNAVDYTKCIAKAVHPISELITGGQVVTDLTDKNQMTLVPSSTIKEAIEMIGEERIEHYKTSVFSGLSAEEKIISFIYNKILTAGQINIDASEEAFVEPEVMIQEEDESCNALEQNFTSDIVMPLELREQSFSGEDRPIIIDDMDEAIVHEPLIVLQEGAELDDVWAQNFSSDTATVFHTSTNWKFDDDFKKAVTVPMVVDNFQFQTLDMAQESAIEEPMVVIEERVAFPDDSSDLSSDPRNCNLFRAMSTTSSGSNMLMSNNDVGPCDVLTDITNIPNSNPIQSLSASKFFVAPPTPKRNPQHRRYRQKSYAILTAGERMKELTAKAFENAEAIKIKQMKSELRIIIIIVIVPSVGVVTGWHGSALGPRREADAAMLLVRARRARLIRAVDHPIRPPIDEWMVAL
ncbi:uncharacterized protein LOC131427254 [Malaya genurostris]|uniref:uncharacterized protein LOC131427254 n=1 Tax=Malaya genurostris TaxID=325434 RepID=UPI0026F3816C|nr:uncharacterized protein LOC131427254 [Malaya genurostris]